MDKRLIKRVLQYQREEKTEYIIYTFLARRIKGNNKKVIERIAEDELKHHDFWRKVTGRDVRPYYFTIFKYIFLHYILGVTFVLKMLERGEEGAQKEYNSIIREIEGARDVLHDEVLHEQALVNLIDEERIGYISSMILGLNDALVELTGALAGFTLSLGSRKTVLLAGFITGFAAALSMAASEYLSTRSEKDSERNPVKAAFYTGGAYLITVGLLLLPFFLIPRPIFSLVGTIIIAIFIIYVFTFYVSVVQERSFGRHFLEMFVISMGVAGVSFIIGFLIKHFIHIDV